MKDKSKDIKTNKLAKPGEKGFYLNEKETLCYGSVCFGVGSIFTLLVLIGSLLVGMLLFIISSLVIFILSLLKIFVGYFKFKELIKKRGKDLRIPIKIKIKKNDKTTKE